ncbi:hypothetical protein P256_02472 [Acinetobacter nectaris CIP 110549]|uniref:Uncharacterized protein n=1 Tax=Acinetobacter nectaris CIP 110549 TaxID=1392540 RepID=V2UMP4_9GAMM|nr:hypothetical protein [Acinetobacter nectaris]ESK36679.1 hypothetical protein P256_02472 [Acinetobacter nectaris CIP 110549]
MIKNNFGLTFKNLVLLGCSHFYHTYTTAPKEIFEYLAADLKGIFDREIIKYTAKIEEDSEGQA